MYDAKIIKVALEALENILRIGKAHKEHPYSGLRAANVYGQQVIDCGGLDEIEQLQNHTNKEVCEHAVRMLDLFFIKPGSGGTVGGAPEPVPAVPPATPETTAVAVSAPAVADVATPAQALVAPEPVPAVPPTPAVTTAVAAPAPVPIHHTSSAVSSSIQPLLSFGAAPPAIFIASSTFAGFREGYVFTMGAMGLGYYRDGPLFLREEPASPPNLSLPQPHIVQGSLQYLPDTAFKEAIAGYHFTLGEMGLGYYKDPHTNQHLSLPPPVSSVVGSIPQWRQQKPLIPAETVAAMLQRAQKEPADRRARTTQFVLQWFAKCNRPLAPMSDSDDDSDGSSTLSKKAVTETTTSDMSETYPSYQPVRLVFAPSATFNDESSSSTTATPPSLVGKKETLVDFGRRRGLLPLNQPGTATANLLTMMRGRVPRAPVHDDNDDTGSSTQ